MDTVTGRASYQKQYSLSETKLTAIQDNFVVLMNDIDVVTGQIVDYFYQERILSSTEVEHIMESENARTRRNRQ